MNQQDGYRFDESGVVHIVEGGVPGLQVITYLTVCRWIVTPSPKLIETTSDVATCLWCLAVRARK